MGLWDWASAAYARPGVADACLALQDEHGQNVPLLLWAAWAGPDADVTRAVEIARSWEASVVLPLRTARRALKTPAIPAPPALREQVKAAELLAERALLEALEALAKPRPGEPLAALTATSQAWGEPADPAALERLATALR